MNDSDLYSIQIDAFTDIDALSEKWLSLEQRSNPPFFLSWSWIRVWLETYSPNVDVLSAYYEGELVALSLICKSVFSSWKRFTSTRLHINQTGDPSLDQIWTEYNGVLCSSEHELSVISRLLPYLIRDYSGWDELQIGAVTKDFAQGLQGNSGLLRLDLWRSPSYGVDLDALKSKQCRFLDSLSRNSRYQIRRSLRLYDAMGGIRLEFARTEQEAQTFFKDISPLHLQKWGNGAGESGFSNPEFIKFHQNLIALCFPLKQIDLIKIVCGERVLGYLYNFVYEGRVYFYLSGLVSEGDSKLKPGLCAHALVIQLYMDRDMKFYDFMGGKDRYKSSLGAVHEELYLISLQKPLLKFKIESFLRDVKRRFIS